MEKDYVLIGSHANRDEFLRLLGHLSINYIVVETDYTMNHFQRLPANCKDRGAYKWLAYTKECAGLPHNISESAKHSHIDNSDCFPRLCFSARSVVSEFKAWCFHRHQEIQKITVPCDFSPTFEGCEVKFLGEDEC